MDLIVAIVVGGVVGWLASIIMKSNAQMGLLLNVVIGVVGSALGYWIAGALGIAPTGGVLRLLVAVGGAALLILLLRLVGLLK